MDFLVRIVGLLIDVTPPQCGPLDLDLIDLLQKFPAFVQRFIAASPAHHYE